ncbi:MAG: single-stranded DNA-binding protein [Spirochaetes bacterium GWD1_61_31]|nr:MAG: single-stranded DNA-binding protein [Spirochaetes bacterium GWB1_60_80]OHD31703.1 MAG: single-stranded DNA-binding protein [Spirochaetes bacterium GWC1_61_12]OHD36246.1 MAG: single-stranded DNA-binding protein [Spirochaetes bacterium GWD1_61_31]OHD41501.1 MAG: single-stranded DNA-binding protein [Spirochaetes bacterium GWE1_60_18]OHD61403.1 MAG: single-stranded DNA-binding protein [Spirochaetes bacterium GWF1_60_12]HAP44534.1 single-stranded DNA-binding protein [Spirochaetaceae bacteri
MLSNLNSIILEGNLVRDPLLKTTPNGHEVCSFAVASNRYYKQTEETEKEVSYFDVETWAKLAQTCGTMLRKGRGVRVVGRLKQDRWLDSAGKTQTKIKIVAEHVEFKPQLKKDDAPDTTEPESATETAEADEATAALPDAVF